MVEFGTQVCLIISISHFWKKSGLKSELVPLLNLLMGLLLTFFTMEDFNLMNLIQQGLLLGLSASGVYDAGKCFKSHH